MKSVALYCGSSVGNCYTFRDAARELTGLLGEQNIQIITGGGLVGLMGIIADEAIINNYHIIGVIPQFLVEKEVAHRGLSELHVVNSMHERKSKIVNMADGFIALPGGFGTLDELFETITWAQLGIHSKPVGILNVDGFYDRLMAHISHMVKENYVNEAHLDLFIVESDPKILLRRMLDYKPRAVDKAKIALGEKK